MKKKITRLYTGPDGEAHFEDIELEFECKVVIDGKTKYLEPIKANLIENDGKYDLDFHPAKHRQLVLLLAGEGELEVGDGTKRRVKYGDILLAEDTTGHGHIARNVGGQPRKMLFVPIEEDK